MENMPLISVIIPCYNHEKYVEESILSVLNQTYKNLQLIVIDDGSKDNSVEIIKRLSDQHHFIFESQANIGLSATLNKAIKKYSNGEYISVVASDDFWHKDKVANQVAYFILHNDVGMVYSKAATVNSESEIVQTLSENRFKEFCTFEDLLLDRTGIPALTVMVNKKVYEKVGLFDENLLIEDWDMWLRIADEYNIGFVNKELAFYRMHDSNISAKLEMMMEERLKIIEKWQRKYPELYKKALLYWQKFAIKTFIPTNRKLARKYLQMNGISLIKYLSYYRYAIKYLLKP